jgi:excinuclease ABC subunit C
VLTERLEFGPDRDSEFFSAIPAAPAVFLLRGSDPQAEPYVSKTANLRRRLHRLLGPPEERTKKLNLRERVRSIEYSPTGSDFESGFLLYQILRETFPKTYSNRLRFRFAPLVKLHLENEFPRASITTRLGRRNGRNLYYGPFHSRPAAEKFMNDSLDFFKMRRCVDDLHPDPNFPGCIYSEMKMCLAPCFKGCTGEEYSAEVNRVQSYFDSAGDSLLREFSAQRESASAALAFEDAAAIHLRIEKLKTVLSQFPEIVRRLDHLSALIIPALAISPTRSTSFASKAGVPSPEPIVFCNPIRQSTQNRNPWNPECTAVLDSFPPTKARSPRSKPSNISPLLKRWYYRGTPQ